LETIIEEAPQKKVDALCQKLLDPATTAGRQRVILNCLKVIKKTIALEPLQQFMVNNFAKEQDIASRAEDTIISLGGKIPCYEQVKSGNVHSFLPEINPLKIVNFRNSYEENAEYILISGGIYNFSVTHKEERVKDLYVAKYPVTNKLYRSFIDFLQEKDSINNLTLFTKLRNELEVIAENKIWGIEFYNYLQEGKNNLANLFRSERDEQRKFGGENQPVVGITWYAAKAYCLWLSLHDSEVNCYRLPTETEWEYAAGGQEKRTYPWGEELPSTKFTNYDQNEGATTPVDRYPQGITPEGLYDISGNVYEWMENLFESNKSDRIARSVRGGSADEDASCLRCAYRTKFLPDTTSSFIGFRVVHPV